MSLDDGLHSWDRTASLIPAPLTTRTTSLLKKSLRVNTLTFPIRPNSPSTLIGTDHHTFLEGTTQNTEMGLTTITRNIPIFHKAASLPRAP